MKISFIPLVWVKIGNKQTFYHGILLLALKTFFAVAYLNLENKLKPPFF